MERVLPASANRPLEMLEGGSLLKRTWFNDLSADGRRAFWAAFAGYGLAGFDLLSFTFVLVAVRDDFGLSGGQAGWLATVSLLASAVGGVIGGSLADSIGRTRTMLLAVAVYAVATFACGLAQNFEQLLLFRVVLGLGFGAEWTASALLVAEYAPAASRGRWLGLLTSAFSIGDVLAAIVAAVVVMLAPPELAWRILFWVGVLPALLIIWARTSVVDAPVFLATKATQAAVSGLGARFARLRASFGAVFGPDLRGITIAATLLASGALSGRYVVTVWVPTLLQSSFGLDQTAVSAVMIPVLAGSVAGYVGGGYCQDRFGRKVTFAGFAVASAVATVLYTRVPPGHDWLLVPAGLFLGFCTSGVLSGMGAYLSELFPTAVRGLGQGFSYSTGRAVAAIPVAVVGVLATADGLGPAMALSVVMYVLCLVALRFLPETKGRNLATA